jgi:hypothetical protein
LSQIDWVWNFPNFYPDNHFFNENLANLRRYIRNNELWRNDEINNSLWQLGAIVLSFGSVSGTRTRLDNWFLRSSQVSALQSERKHGRKCSFQAWSTRSWKTLSNNLWIIGKHIVISSLMFDLHDRHLLWSDPIGSENSPQKTLDNRSFKKNHENFISKSLSTQTGSCHRNVRDRKLDYMFGSLWKRMPTKWKIPISYMDTLSLDS